MSAESTFDDIFPTVSHSHRICAIVFILSAQFAKKIFCGRHLLLCLYKIQNNSLIDISLFN